MSTPSLLLVPARLKAGTLFSQIPTNGSGDFTVVQAVGNATRYNSSGFVESAKTNLALRSEEFRTIAEGGPSNSWGANDTVIISVNNLSPYGTNNATRIRGAASPTNRVRQQVVVGTSGVTYVGSAWIRRVSGTSPITLRVGDTGSTTNISPTSTWQRYSFSSTPTTTTVRIAFVFPNDTDEFEIWGAQLEVGSSASEYIPTTTVARTRFAGVTVDGTVAANIPRLDYYTSNGTPGCPGLLVEASGTNLAKYSDQFDTVTSGWTAAGLQTITGNTTATLDPAGGNTADLIVATTGTTTHNIRPNSNNLPAFVSGTTYTYSVFAKATSATSGFVQIYFGDIVFSPVGPYANFQLSGNGAVTTGTYSAASIQPFGNGWYRCSITATAAANGVVTAPFMPILASGTARGATFAGNGVDGVYLWGAQLETGSVATSYIPTTTAQRTRNADVIYASGGVSGSIGQTEGSIYVEVDIQKLLGTTQRAFIDIGQTNNRLFLGYGNGLTNKIRFLLQTSAGGLVDFESAATTTGIIRIAVGYKNNDSAMYVNGVSVSPISNGSFTATLTTLSNIYLGSSLSAADFLNDKINAVALYATRLSNDALMLLSMQGNDAYLPQAIWNFYEDSRAGNTEVPTCLYTRHADLLDV